MNIRKTNLNDQSEIITLYHKVAAEPGGILRLVDEIDTNYVHNFLKNTTDYGIGLVIYDEHSNLVGEIHAYPSKLFCFSHVLSELTIVVDPDVQGKGVGRMLFEAFMDTVITDYPALLRIELVARESNHRAIEFYQSLGFNIEGKFESRIRNIDGSLEADISMAWIR